MKFIKNYLVLLSLPLFVNNIALAAVTCSSNGAGYTDTSTCNTQPDEQYLTFYKVAICTGSPTAPTLATSYDISQCKVIFQNNSGSKVLVAKNKNTSPSGGQVSIPPAGKYTYGFVEVAPTFEVKKKAIFSTVRRGLYANRSVLLAGIPTTLPAGNLGTVCVSEAVTLYTIGTNPNGAVTCGVGPDPSDPAGITTSFLNSFDPNGFVNSMTFTATQGGTINAYLVDSSGKLGAGAVDGPGTISRLIGYLPINLTIPEIISTMSTTFNNSQGTSINFTTIPAGPLAGQSAIYMFSGGPFDFSFEVK